jgi:hypothetical protein
MPVVITNCTLSLSLSLLRNVSSFIFLFFLSLSIKVFVDVCVCVCVFVCVCVMMSNIFYIQIPERLTSGRSMDIENISPLVIKFELDELVDVVPRFWPGINKAGGTARVREVNADNNTYSVAYVLGGKEDHIDAKYIHKKSDNDGEEKASRKRMPVQSLQPEEFHKPAPKKKLQEDIKKPPKPKLKLKKKVLLSKDIVVKQTAISSSHVPASPSIEMESSCGDVESLAGTGGAAVRQDISPVVQEIVQNLLAAVNACSPLSCGGYLTMDILNYFMETMEGCESDDIELALLVSEDDNKIMIIDDGENGRVVHVI